jgi:hypothetical protein
MYSWVESLTSHCVVCCCCDWSSCCCDKNSDGCACGCCSSKSSSCCNGSCDDWVAACCDWISCGPVRVHWQYGCSRKAFRFHRSNVHKDSPNTRSPFSIFLQCRNRCFGWSPCPSPDDSLQQFHPHHADGTYRNGAPRHPGDGSLEPPYLELQGSADDEIPYERVFEMEQKKRRLFASASTGQGGGGSGGSGSHLAQVH